MKGPLRLDPEFTQAVLRWYAKCRRTLPWRESSDPYAIWVSEVMLQQTRVESVLPFFKRFLKEFPRLQDLAAADENKVLSLWSGLGYYRRARNLLEAAKRICRDHGGRFPDRLEEAVGLPGVGRYTAAAVLSIARGQPHAVLDGNVRRLLARFLRLEQELDGPLERRLWKLLDELVRDPIASSRIAELNQGLMELGALVCRPRNPLCPECPLKMSCRAYEAGLQDRIPPPRQRRPTQTLTFLSAVIEAKGTFLLKRNDGDPYLKGLWEFPRVAFLPPSEAVVAFRRIHGLHLEPATPLPPVRHSVTFRRLIFHPVRATLRRPVRRHDFAWVRPGQPEYPCSSYIGKILDRLPGLPEKGR